MGIKGMSQVIESVYNEPNETKLTKFSGKTIAIDASMGIFQSLIATSFTKLDKHSDFAYLIGFYNTSVHLLENRVKPIYVFDGNPPQQKMKLLKLREHRRKVAKAHMEKAQEAGESKAAEKYRRQTLKLQNHHVEDTKALLNLLGIPYIEAPGEAEAQCAELEKAGKVHATASEDLDSLTFGSRVLLRQFNLKGFKNNLIEEIRLDKILQRYGIDIKQFIDLSILLGCDYCDHIQNLGPIKAVRLIKQYCNLEGVLENIDTDVYRVPQDWTYNMARYLFEKPLVTKPDQLEIQWKRPKLKLIRQFLCDEKKLSLSHVKSGLAKLERLSTKK